MTPVEKYGFQQGYLAGNKPQPKTDPTAEQRTTQDTGSPSAAKPPVKPFEQYPNDGEPRK